MKQIFSYEKTDDLHKFLLDSTNWMIIRINKDGLHLSMKDDMDWVLMAVFLAHNDEMYNAIVKEVNILKKKLK
jgi:hypothetical protein